ncbi:Transducin beta-like protein 2 [Hordeum vulgare]|nr:Transducin beta-like protein 2 [Hordeum vulgare]
MVFLQGPAQAQNLRDSLVQAKSDIVVKEAAKKHHHLDLNTLRGHTDCVIALDFSSDACNLTTGEPTLSLPFDQDLSCLRTETF